MERVAVIDFETTGLSPAMGDRATEIAAVILEGGRVVDRYQSLMNAGVRVPAHIEALTGISNAMLREAPPASDVKRASKAALWATSGLSPTKSATARITRKRQQEFACSLLLARRLLPQAPSHKLGALIEFTRLPVAGRYHRALADAEMAASLLLRLEAELVARHQVAEVSHALLRTIQAAPKHQLERCLARHRQAAPADA